jgi:hypothetical protein
MGPGDDDVDVRKLFGSPETAPTTRLVAATHEAAHVVTAAVLGMAVARAWVRSDDAVGHSGAMPLLIPNRFEHAHLRKALASADERVRDAAAADVEAMCRVCLAAYVFQELHSLPERWTCLGDWDQALAFLHLVDDDCSRLDVVIDKNRRSLRRLDVRYAIHALAAELLERGQIDSSTIREVCERFGLAAPNVGGRKVETLFPDEEWQSLNRLARAKDVTSEAIFAEAYNAWIDAGQPDVEVPGYILPLYVGKPMQFAYYKIVRWWLRSRAASM